MDFEHSFDRLLNEYLKSRYPNRVRDSLIETLAQEAKVAGKKDAIEELRLMVVEEVAYGKTSCRKRHDVTKNAQRTV